METNQKPPVEVKEPIEHLCIACGKAHANCCGLCPEWYQPVNKIPSQTKMGDKFRLIHGCPECYGDLLVNIQVSERCEFVEFENGRLKPTNKCNHTLMGG